MVYLLVFAAVAAVALLLLWAGRKSDPGAARQSADDAGAPRRARDAIVVAPIEAAAPASAESDAIPEALQKLEVLRAAELDAAGASRIADICAAMPEPHPVQLQMARGLDTPEELMDAIVSDAGLTATILRTVNSAAFVLEAPITSVRHAITYLGVVVVKNVVAQAAIAEHAEAGTETQQQALAHVWRSACVASAFAQLLARELGLERPSVLATKSLFFNLGDVALILSGEEAVDAYREGSSLAERVWRQQEEAGLNSAILGAALADAWSLPSEISAAIEAELLPLTTAPAEHPMAGAARRENVLLYLAGRIGDHVTYRGLRNVAELPLDDPQEPDTFFLGGHLEAADLGRVRALLQDAGFRRRANRLIETLAA
ncbi:MAG: HDOD domain-containing protein [Halieaceae bacterium]|jgi:HD-like signal output (HDOD) protein|nr:HDOD domain-containing protein [Halieaceae bacterium]